MRVASGIALAAALLTLPILAASAGYSANTVLADNAAPANAAPLPALPALPALPPLKPAPAVNPAPAPPPQAGPTTPAQPPALPPALPPPLPTDVPKPPPLPPPAPVVTFFVAENGQPVGPLTLDQVGAEIAAKRITSKSLVWKSGDPAWIAADQVPELKPILGNVPPPVPEDDKWTRFMIGTWQTVVNTENNGQTFTQTFTIQFRPDGTFAGVVTFAINGQTGQSQPLSGTWEAKAVSGDQFTLTQRIPGQPPFTGSLRRVGDNDIANVNDGSQSRRVGG